MDDHMLEDPIPFKERWRRRAANATSFYGRLRGKNKSVVTEDPELPPSPVLSQVTTTAVDSVWDECDDVQSIPSQKFARRPTHLKPRTRSFTAMVDSSGRIPPTTPLEGSHDPSEPSSMGEKMQPVLSGRAQLPPPPRSPSPVPSRKRRSVVSMLLTILKNVPPPTWAVVLGITFSLVQPLKALLTDTAGWTETRMPDAPDGNPPLHFILETTTFLGAITVPMALILLGASFARLKVGNSFYGHHLQT